VFAEKHDKGMKSKKPGGRKLEDRFILKGTGEAGQSIFEKKELGWLNIAQKVRTGRRRGK